MHGYEIHVGFEKKKQTRRWLSSPSSIDDGSRWLFPLLYSSVSPPAGNQVMLRVIVATYHVANMLAYNSMTLSHTLVPQPSDPQSAELLTSILTCNPNHAVHNLFFPFPSGSLLFLPPFLYSRVPFPLSFSCCVMMLFSHPLSPSPVKLLLFASQQNVLVSVGVFSFFARSFVDLV